MLNEKEKELLKAIVADKYSVGAFSGMVTNMVWSSAVESATDIGQSDIDRALRVALATRLRLQELSEQ